ncbi:MAG: lysylphosphatidylglycerol synthase domain-containing protein [Myxococcales bacterium]
MKPAEIIRALGAPKLFIPTILSLALLAFVLSLANLDMVAAGLKALSVGDVFVVFALAVGYLLLKGVQIYLLLCALGIDTRPGQLVSVYAIGEMANSLPIGEFSQNWLLQKLQGTRFATSAAATTASLMLEGAVTLTTLLVLGIPGWPWLRPAIGAFFAVSFVWTSALLCSRRARQQGERLVTRGVRFRKLGEGLVALLKGIRMLIAPVPLLAGALLSVSYLLLIALVYFVVARAVGIADFTFEAAVTVYFFGLAVTLLLGPISTQLGVIEATSLGAMLACGFPRDQALVLLLVVRVLWMGSTWLACGGAALAVRREYRASP